MTLKEKRKLLNQLQKNKSLGLQYFSPNIFKKTYSNALEASNLCQLEELTLSCHLCQKAKIKNQVIFARGNKNSKIMILLPQVTSQDDKVNFSPSGKIEEILIDILGKYLGLKLNDLYITNILKCQMGNFSPSYDDISSCKKYLDKQIELISPKIIISFGLECYNYLFNDEIEYSKILDQNIFYKGTRIFICQSLELLIRNPSFENKLKNDMQKICQILEKI